MTNVLDLASKRVQLKKVSSTHGGEWQGPCPGCGGENRFHVWPEQNEGQGGYWCRGCEKAGDAIQYLRDFEGMTFGKACAMLHLAPPEHPAAHGSKNGSIFGSSPERVQPEFIPAVAVSPPGLWQEKAEKLVAWAADNLTQNVPVLSWLAERGISAETAAKYRLGWNPGEDGRDLYRPRKSWGLPELLKEDGRPKALWIPAGLVIPYVTGGVIQRIRIRRPEGEPRFYVLPGSSMATMLLEPARRAFVVIESELDAIAVAAGNSLAGAVGLGSVSAKPDAAAFTILKGAIQLLNALDFDGPGAKASTWWEEEFTRCDRWPVPKGKDPGEAFKLGIDLAQWIKAGLPPALTIGEPKEKEAAAAAPRIIFPPLTEEDKRRIAAMPAEVAELLTHLRNNTSVRIINRPDRFAVLRGSGSGKPVGGRINELVYRCRAVTDYLSDHPAEEINGGNFIIRSEG